MRQKLSMALLPHIYRGSAYLCEMSKDVPNIDWTGVEFRFLWAHPVEHSTAGCVWQEPGSKHV